MKYKFCKKVSFKDFDKPKGCFYRIMFNGRFNIWLTKGQSSNRYYYRIDDRCGPYGTIKSGYDEGRKNIIKKINSVLTHISKRFRIVDAYDRT